MDNALRLIGLARKGGRVEVGEEPVGAAARARKARLVVLAADAADNTLRRASHFALSAGVPVLQSPYTKGELGLSVGRSSCAMLAITDYGLLRRKDSGQLPVFRQEQKEAPAWSGMEMT